ncbi:MAG: bifunctional oligoribonuclease/PAP phosphatase NrnA [Tissierellia bacterium]|nr:bifunctional oligoribonuclease/PAP phosphatase NrnA [Tissierellia bacterium]
MEKTYAEIEKKILEARDISLVSHINPDGDNIGSILGLGAALRKMGKDVHILKVDDIPKNLLFLPRVEEIKPMEKRPDLLFVLDSSDEGRLGDGSKEILKANYIINIDHHKSNTLFGDINLVDASMSSTGEMVYDLIDFLGVELDNEIATPIYTAINSDTGSFRYESTSPDTLRKAANLLEFVDNKVEITKNLYQSRTKVQTEVIKIVLNNLESFDDLSLIIGKISLNDLERLGAQSDDTEGVVPFINEIEGYDVAIFLKEKEEGIVRVSARSKEVCDVSILCEKFDGGGHKRAAGATIEGNLDEAIEKLISAYKEL